MRFCEECGSMMRTEGDAWVCRSCESEEPRDSHAEASMTTQDGQRDDGAPPVVDATRDATETTQESCPVEDCDSDRAEYETRPK
ncbi:MAG: RPA12/RPB9/RPC11 RNA polymerase family protein, partial [Halolamina sp.]